MNQYKPWIAALFALTATSACFPERPERVGYPLSTVTRQSLDNYDLTIDGKRFLTHDKDGIRYWAKLLVDQGIPVDEKTTLIDIFPDARYAPFGPFADIRVNDPAFVDWVTLEGTRARRFVIKTPICAGSPGGFTATIKCPELDAVLITPEVLYGVSRMVGFESVSLVGMYAGTQEDLIKGLQAIIDKHNPRSMGLSFVSEDGIAPPVCSLKFGDNLNNLVWVERAEKFAAQYAITQEASPTTIFSPFDIVRMQVRAEEIAKFQSKICED